MSRDGAEAGGATVGAWLAMVTPEPPPALARRLAEMLEPHVAQPQREVADACLAAGERHLAALLDSRATSRQMALDLLAIDALVTYAFEAAADQPARFEALAAEAMARFSRLPGPPAS